MDRQQLNSIIKELNGENEKASVKIYEIDPEKPFRILNFRRSHLEPESLELELEDCFVQMPHNYWRFGDYHFDMLSKARCSIMVSRNSINQDVIKFME